MDVVDREAGGDGTAPALAADMCEASVPVVPDEAQGALFAVMRATFWATGEDLLRRLVCALATALGRDFVLAESVTTPACHLGLWIAESSSEAFRYQSVPFGASVADEAAVARAVSEIMGGATLGAFPVRSPSGRPLGQLLSVVGPRRASAIGEAALLSPQAARAGPELARLRPAQREPGEATALVHMCAWCKGVRDTRRSWHTIEEYLRRLTGAGVSHGICPACTRHTHTR
jgi:hypothetical protein